MSEVWVGFTVCEPVSSGELPNPSETQIAGPREIGAREKLERAHVVQEALTWRKTPYVGNGDVKGAGVDCGMFLVRVFADTGLIEPFDPRPYPMQWSLHQSRERFLELVQSYSHEIMGPPLPGDVALFKFGKGWAHASIVIDWPKIIHANPPGACRIDDAVANNQLARMPPRFFSVWPRQPK